MSQAGDEGHTWSAPVILHSDSSPNEHGFVAMWREPGRLGLVWLDGRSFTPDASSERNEMTLMCATIDASGAVGRETVIDERACDCCQNAAAMTSNGPVVVYRDRSPAEIRDIYVTRRVGTTWTRGAPVHSDGWHINACPVNAIHIGTGQSRRRCMVYRRK